MERLLNTGAFEAMDNQEQMLVEGGGVTAFVYALGFMAGCSPLAVCVGAGIALVGVGCCVYGIATH